ncbi:MAG: VWA domain-containing protein [Anaerolineae bacterium]|nr:MAG: VWA domain-containing protein [Anaerolineae bacterium]
MKDVDWATSGPCCLGNGVGEDAMDIRRFLGGVMVGVLMCLMAGGDVTPVAAQQQPPQPDDVIQIVLVLDISDSMKHPLLSEDLPEEISTLSEQISAIENDPALQTLNQAIEAALNDPAVLMAQAAWQTAAAELDSWLSENGYADGVEAVRATVGEKLAEMGCQVSPQYTLQMAVAGQLDELDYWIDQACAGAGIGFEGKQALRDLIPYLGEAGYIPLRQAYVDTLVARNNELEALDYFNLLQQRDQFYADSGYHQLQAEYDAKLDELGIPRKIDLARQAARTLIDLARLDENAGRRTSVFALVVFSTESALLQPLTADLEAVEGRILKLEPQYQTNIYAALDDALQELEQHRDPQHPSLVILLSDGHTNVGPGPDEILADMPPRAREIEARICTVGIGQTEAHVDRQLLRSLAEETGGQYLFARKGEELVNFFVACRQGVVGEVTQLAGYIASGESRTLDAIALPDQVCEFSLALNYLNGDPALTINDPQGRNVSSGYDGFLLQEGTGLKLYTLLKPAAGDWQITVLGGDQGEGEIFYNIVVTSSLCEQTPTPVVTPTPYFTRTPLPPPGLVEQTAPVLPVVVLVLLVMGGFLVVALLRRRG